MTADATLPTTQDVTLLIDNLHKILDYSHEANVGAAMLELLGNTETLIAHAEIDPETGQRQGFSVTVLRGTKTVTRNRSELLDALRAVFSQEQGKKCKGECSLWKPLGSFSRLSDSPDRHNRRCKVCERKRVKRYEDRRKGKIDDVPGLPVASALAVG